MSEGLCAVETGKFREVEEKEERRECLRGAQHQLVLGQKD